MLNVEGFMLEVGTFIFNVPSFMLNIEDSTINILTFFQFCATNVNIFKIDCKINANILQNIVGILEKIFNFASTNIFTGETARQLLRAFFVSVRQYAVSVPLCGTLMRPQPVRC